MGVDLKYGHVTTEHGDIPDDEPVIVFRARDALTPKLIGIYWNLCHQAGSPQRHLALIHQAHEVFDAWQDANPDRVRTPDSERSREWLDGASEVAAPAEQREG